MIFSDYFFEKDFLSIKDRQNRLYRTYKQQAQANPQLAESVIAITENNPFLPKSVVKGAAMLGEDPNSDRLNEINSQLYEQYSKKEAEIWEFMNEKYSSEEYVDDMRFTAKNWAKGDTQYGVWIAAAMEHVFETFSKYSPLPNAGFYKDGFKMDVDDGKGGTVSVPNPDSPMAGRVWQYTQSLFAYDKMLRDGVDPSIAQNVPRIDISKTQVANLGKDLGWLGQIDKMVNIFKEAQDMAGETVYQAMRKKVAAGEPINYDRDRWFIFSTIDAEKMPQYNDLTNIYGYTPEQAKELIHKYIGEPIAPIDEPGEINYLSLEKPNKINFYAGRRNKTFNYTSEDVLRSKEGYEQLLPYSPGRYQAAFVTAPGTEAFNKLSGGIDLTYKLIPELFADKGVRQIQNQFKNLRRVNKLLDQETGEILDSGKRFKLSEAGLREEAYRQIAKDIDGLDGEGVAKALMNHQNKLRSINNKGSRVFKATERQIKQYGFFGERVPKFFRQTKDEFLETPFMQQLFTSLADESNAYVIKANPFFRNIDGRLIQRIADESNPAKIQEYFGKLLDEGVQIGKYTSGTFSQIDEMPKVASFALNKLLIDTARKGKNLQASENIVKQLAGRGLSAIGNEQAAFRSARSYLGEGLNIATQPFKKRNKKYLSVLKPLTGNDKVVDGTLAASRWLPKKESVIESLLNAKSNVEEFARVTDKQYEKLLGFNSTFNAGATPSQQRMMGLIPEMGLPLRNFSQAYDQLFAHLQATGYDEATAGAILKEFSTMKYSDHRVVRKFAYEQRVRDIQHVKAKGGQHEILAEALENYSKAEEDRFIMFINEFGDDMPFAGNMPEGLEKVVYKNWDGTDREMIIPSAHLLSEMADNAVQLTDYNLMKRAMSPLFTYYDNMDSMLQTFTIPLKDAKDYITKYKFGFSKEYDNPFIDFDTGQIKGIPIDKMGKDAITMTLDYYNRNLFKPAVLLRYAFFTRVFLEESMRFAAGHMDSFFTHPIHYIQWVTMGGDSKLGKMVRLGKESIDENKLLDSFEHLKAMNSTFSIAGLQGRATTRNKHVKYVMRTKTEMEKGAKVSDIDYAQAVRFELMMLRSDTIARKVAEYGYGSEELSKWIMSNEGAVARRELVNMGGGRFKKILNDSDFIDQYLQSVEARIRIKTGGQVNKGTEYFYDETIQGYRYNINATDTGNANLRQAIATGKLHKWNDAARTGESISFLEDVQKRMPEKVSLSGKTTISDIDKELKLYVGDKGLNLDLGAVKISEDIVNRKYLGPLANFEKGMDKLVDIAFDHIMRKPNAYLSRSVAFKQFRYMHILDNFENYSYRVRDEFIKEAQQLGVPKKVIKDMKDARNATRSGSIDNFKVADINAKAFGLSGTKQLLYDTSKRHQLSDITRNIFPFPEVWFELATTWSKLLADNPYLIRKGQLFLNGARGSNLFGYDRESFFTPDPQNPKNELFVHPFSGFLGSLIYGKDRKTDVAAKSYVTGINLLGQGFVPGPNPYVAFALDKVLPKYGTGVEAREVLFGDFGAPKVADVLLPKAPWLKKLIAGVGGFGKDIDDYGTSIYKSEYAMMRASTTIDIYRYGMLTGENRRLYKAGKLDKFLAKKYGEGFNKDLVTKSDIDEAFLEYSNSKAKYVFLLRAVAQGIGPVGFKPTYYAEDDQGKLWSTQVLAEEFRKIREDLNQDDVAASEEFFRQFGYDHGWLTSGKSVSIAGRRSITDRVKEWQAENEEKLGPYTLSSFFLLPDNPLDQRSFNDLYDESIMLNPDQYRRSVNDTVAYYKYAAFSQKLDENETMSNDEKVMLKRTVRNGLIIDYPGFQSQTYGLTTAVKAKDIFAEMEREWLKEGSFALTTDAGKGFEKFYPVWQAMSAQSAKYSTTNNPEWWLSSTKDEARYMRIMAHQVAMEVAKENPDFYYVWIGVMLRLYRDDTEALQFGATLGR